MMLPRGQLNYIRSPGLGVKGWDIVHDSGAAGYRRMDLDDDAAILSTQAAEYRKKVSPKRAQRALSAVYAYSKPRQWFVPHEV